MKDRIKPNNLKVYSFRFPIEYMNKARKEAKSKGYSMAELIWRKLQYFDKVSEEYGYEIPPSEKKK